jgi:phospholipid transport system substrate-binding protein
MPAKESQVPTRRRLLATVAAISLAALATLPPQARAQASEVAFLRNRGDQLLAIVNADTPEATKQDAVGRLLAETVDLDGVARFVVGRYWRTATAEEQKEYLSLFGELTKLTIAARFGELKGLKFQVLGPTRRDEEAQGIATLIERPGQPPATVEWKVAQIGPALKVVDLVAEGTSLRLTQRSEYTSVLQRNNGQFSGLMAAMRRQMAQLRPA